MDVIFFFWPGDDGVGGEVYRLGPVQYTVEGKLSSHVKSGQCLEQMCYMLYG